MAYEKHNWNLPEFQKGDQKFIDNLNHIENGIAEVEEGSKNIWHELELSRADLRKLADGNKLVRNIGHSYDPTNYIKDYIRCKIAETKLNPPYSKATDLGVIKDIGSTITNIYFSGYQNSWYTAKMQEALIEVTRKYGFTQEHYMMGMLFADANVGAGLKHITANPLNEEGSIYVTDITQQAWEKVYDGIEYSEWTGEVTDRLEEELFGKQFVIQIKSNTPWPHGNDRAIMLCFEDDRAIASIVGDVMTWTDVHAGYAYFVEWDFTHRRYIVKKTIYEPGIPEAKGSIPDEWLQDMRNTPLAVNIQISADTAQSTNYFWKTKTIAPYFKAFTHMFSCDTPFTEVEASEYYEYIGEPRGYDLENLVWTSGSTRHLEKDGAWTWVVDIPSEGIFEIKIPYNTPNKAIISLSADPNIARYNLLVRHTFNINGDLETKASVKLHISKLTFNLLNTQVGADDIYYLMLSDAAGWQVAASGFIWEIDTPANVYSISKVYNTVQYVGGTTPHWTFDLYADAVQVSGTGIGTTRTFEISRATEKSRVIETPATLTDRYVIVGDVLTAKALIK